MNATASGVRQGPTVSLSRAEISGRVQGHLDALRIDATVVGHGLQVGDQPWHDVTAHAERAAAAGSSSTPRSTTARTGRWRSPARSTPRARAVTGVEAPLFKRDANEITGKVARVCRRRRAGSRSRASISEGAGVGQLKGGLRVIGNEIVGKLRGDNVDLGKVAQFAQLPLQLKGLANIDVDLESSGPGNRKGHVALELVDGEAAVVTGVSGVFSATFDGDHVRTDGLLRIVARATAAGEKPGERCDGSIANLRVTGGDGRLPGPLLDPASWRRASGQIEVAADEWNLRCVRRLVPSVVPVPEMRGKLTTRATIGASLRRGAAPR